MQDRVWALRCAFDAMIDDLANEESSTHIGNITQQATRAPAVKPRYMT